MISRPFPASGARHPGRIWARVLYERRCSINAARLGGLDLTPGGIEPDVSILIIARNNYEQTANCIVSAFYNTRASIEVVLFDSASTDNTRNLPSINPQIKYIRAERNLGFTIPVNRAAEIATGRMIFLLNNDVELTPCAIDNALETLEADRSVGAVGAKIVRMHGRLQEGGSIVWRDGSCLGYGRDRDPPSRAQVCFVQDVDFCSGCFLAIRRSDWVKMGGFDEAYAPAYYEETDFCVRMWDRGYRVVSRSTDCHLALRVWLVLSPGGAVGTDAAKPALFRVQAPEFLVQMSASFPRECRARAVAARPWTTHPVHRGYNARSHEGMGFCAIRHGRTGIGAGLRTGIDHRPAQQSLANRATRRSQWEAHRDPNKSQL